MELDQTISQKLDRVLYILENDDRTNRKGLVEQVQDIQNQLNQLLEREKIFVAKAIMLGFLGGIFLTVGTWIFENFFINKK